MALFQESLRRQREPQQRISPHRLCASTGHSGHSQHPQGSACTKKTREGIREGQTAGHRSFKERHRGLQRHHLSPLAVPLCLLALLLGASLAAAVPEGTLQNASSILTPWQPLSLVDAEWEASEWRDRLSQGHQGQRALTFPPSASLSDGLFLANRSRGEESRWEQDLQAGEGGGAAPGSSNLSRRHLAALRACNYAQGRWVYDKNRRPAYSGLSCKAIRSSYNCMRNGRRDTAFFHYRWQPSGCNMPDFNPKTFLSLVKNKIVGFVGDSIGRNFQQSLTCMMTSALEVKAWAGHLGGTPVSGEYYPQFGTRIYTVASPYFMKYSSDSAAFKQYKLKPNNKYGVQSYVIWLDQPDPAWANLLRYTDLVIFVGSHWYQESQGSTKVRNDVFVYKNKVQKGISGLQAYGIALRGLKGFVLNRKNFGGVVAFGTNTPSHYNSKSTAACSNQVPLAPTKAAALLRYDPAVAVKQMEANTFRGTKARLIDLTSMSLFRPDGHVQLYYGAAKNSHTKWDCLHWCLPGVPDSWGSALQFVLRTKLWSFRV